MFTMASIKATARGIVGWRHTFGNRTPLSVNAFGESSTFSVADSPIARDSVITEPGPTSVSLRPQVSVFPIAAKWQPALRITASKRTLRCNSDHPRTPASSRLSRSPPATAVIARAWADPTPAADQTGFAPITLSRTSLKRRGLVDDTNMPQRNGRENGEQGNTRGTDYHRKA